MLADAATLWQIEANAICSLRSCDWSHWDPTIHWPKLPDLWKQGHSETVDCLFHSCPFRSFVDPRKDHHLHCTIISLNFFGVLLRVSGSRTNLFMRFKSTAKSGLLLWRGESPMRANSDFLSMGLQDGALIFRWGLGCHTKLDEHPAEAEKMALLQDGFGRGNKVYQGTIVQTWNPLLLLLFQL